MDLGSGVGVRVAPGSSISRLLTLSLENYSFSDWDFSLYCAHCWSKLSLPRFPMAFSNFTYAFLYSPLPKVPHARSSSQSHGCSTWSWVFLFIFSHNNPFSGPDSPASSTMTTLHPFYRIINCLPHGLHSFTFGLGFYVQCSQTVVSWMPYFP